MRLYVDGGNCMPVARHDFEGLKKLLLHLSLYNAIEQPTTWDCVLVLMPFQVGLYVSHVFLVPHLTE